MSEPFGSPFPFLLLQAASHRLCPQIKQAGLEVFVWRQTLQKEGSDCLLVSCIVSQSTKLCLHLRNDLYCVGLARRRLLHTLLTHSYEQCRISSVANVACATGLALLGASRHPMNNFLRHHRTFPRSVGKPAFSKAYLTSHRWAWNMNFSASLTFPQSLILYRPSCI